jgi:hypothetical protein
MYVCGIVSFGVFRGFRIRKAYHPLLFDFSIPRIDRIRLPSTISRGKPSARSNHFVKSIILTSCSTGIFVTRTLTEFNPLSDPRNPLIGADRSHPKRHGPI